VVAARGAVGVAVRSFAGKLELTPKQLLDAPVHWPRPGVLEVSLEALEGVGAGYAKAAAEAGIATVGDLLLRVPHRHRDRTLVLVSDLEAKKEATIRVEVLGSEPRPFRRRGLSITSVKVGDGSDTIKATWFNQPWVARKLTTGTRLLLTGSKDKRGFTVKEYELLPPVEEGEGGGVPPACWVFRPESDSADRRRGRGEKRDAAAPGGHPTHPSRWV